MAQVADEGDEQATGTSTTCALNGASHTGTAHEAETAQAQKEKQKHCRPMPQLHIWDSEERDHGVQSHTPAQQPVRSQRHWQADGDVVLRVERTLFKITRTRLGIKCTRLRRALLDVPYPGAVRAGTEVVEGCPVLGQNLAALGVGALHFEWFLLVLYHHDRYVPPCPCGRRLDADADGVVHSVQLMTKLPDTELISLMRTARLLGEHTDVYPSACNELGSRYRQDVPPQTRAPQPGETEPYKTAVGVLVLAREHGIPGLIKCAAYRILADPRFWANMGAVLQCTGQLVVDVLREAEVLKLYVAREWLQREWRRLVCTPPCPVEYVPEDGEERHGHVPANDTACKSCMEGRGGTEWCVKTAGREREREWYLTWCKLVEKGAEDPFAALGLLDERSAELRKGWCERCLDERRNAWNAARVRWWAQMDGRLTLAC